MQSIKEHKRKRQRMNKVTKQLTMSFIGIFACALGMGISAYAWFTSSASISVQTLTAANYSIDTTVQDFAKSSVISTDGSGLYNLKGNVKYQISLSKNISSTATKGYALVMKDGKAWYRTEQITSGTFTFTFAPTEDGIYSFTGVWGEWENLKVQADDVILLKNGQNIGQAQVVTSKQQKQQPQPSETTQLSEVTAQVSEETPEESSTSNEQTESQNVTEESTLPTVRQGESENADTLGEE